MSKTILVVEDDSSVAQMLEDVLTREGFDVVVEADGEGALRTFAEQAIDLAIVDVLLEKIQGFDLIPQIRATKGGADLPIIVISGVFRGQTYKDDMSKRFDIHAYFDKPLDLDVLIDALHDVFSSAYPEPVPVEGDPSERVMPRVRTPTFIDRGEPPPLALEMKGDLEDVSFGMLLGGLFARRVTGALMLRRSSVKKLVYFTDGAPVFVKSNLLSECLGRVMVSERLITQDECDRSLERKKRETGRRQGEILVEMGSISQHNLEFALELQMQNKLFDAFAWRDGRYQFNPAADYRGPQVPVAMGATTLVHEGASRQMESERIAAELEPLLDRPVVISSEKSFRYQALQLDPRAERMIDRIDGRRTLRDLIALADFGKRDARVVMYSLIATALLRTVAEPPPSQRVDPPTPLDLQDVQALSTGEIDAIAKLDKLPTPAPTAPPPAPTTGEQPTVDEVSVAQLIRELGTGLIVGPTVESVDEAPEPITGPTLDPATSEPPELVTEPPAPAPIPAPTPTPPPAPMDAPELAERRRPPARESSLPRTGKWGAASSHGPEPEMVDDSEPPDLSDDVRREVRARLETQIAAVAETRRREKNRSSAPRRTPKKRAKPNDLTLDLDAVRERSEGELAAKYERLSRKTYYEILHVNPDATAAQIQAAYKAESKKLDPERVVAGRGSHAARMLAEKIYLLATRALNTLTNNNARQEYDRLIGIDPGPRIASLFIADSAFERGRAAMAVEDWPTAEAELLEAVTADEDDAVLHAHLAFVRFSRTPEDARVREACLEVLISAAEQCADDVEVQLFLGAIARKHGDKTSAVQAYRRAIDLDADCVTALSAMRTLVPPVEKKSGLLSRYFAG